MLWSGDTLAAKLSELKHGGVYDSFHELYKLIMSLLKKWFDDEHAKVRVVRYSNNKFSK